MATPARAAEEVPDSSPAPDYVPGWIQAHGALQVASSPEGAKASSANATMLGALPRPGQPPDEGHLTRDILEVLRAGFAGEAAAGATPASGVSSDGRRTCPTAGRG